MDKKWAFSIVSAIIIIPALTFGWKNVQGVWAAPDDIRKIESKLDKAYTAQEQIALMVVEQKVRQDKADIVNTMQIQALKESNQATKEQLQLIAEIKKGKK